VPDNLILRISLGPLLLLGFTASAVRAQNAPFRVEPSSNEGPILTVERVVETALTTNPRVGAAREMVSAAQGSRRTARSWTNPSFTYQTEEMDVVGAHGTGATAREAMWTAMLPLEPIYQLGSRATRANAEVRAAEADFRSARREIALRAVGDYYATALAQVSVNGLQEIATWLDSLVAYTRARVREGAAAEVDLIRLQVEQDRAGTDLAISRAELARSRAELASLIGTDSFAVDPVVATKVPPGFANAVALDALTSQATTHRPEIAAADARVKAAGAAVSLEQRAVLRELGVMAGVKRMLGDASVVAGLSMPLPIFDRNRGEIQRARAQQRLAAFDRESTERQVVAEVRAAYAAVTMLGAQVARIDGSMLQRAEESRRIAEGAYREGATSLTQVLDAARSLVEARESYYRAVFARNQSLIELNAAIGSENLLTIPFGGVR
jgi:cobalt-zinc-cadmium efflux system outer membrane protein